MEFCFKKRKHPNLRRHLAAKRGGELPPLMCKCGRATTGSLFSEGGGVGQDTLQLHGGHMLIRSRDLVKEGEAWFLWLSSCGWGGSIGHEHHGMDLSIPPWTPHILQLG